MLKKNLESIKKTYRINRDEIGYVKFILEAYDNLAILSTVDSQLGIVRLIIPPGNENEVNCLIDGLIKETLIETISEKNAKELKDDE